jgi:hypothetical protein
MQHTFYVQYVFFPSSPTIFEVVKSGAVHTFPTSYKSLQNQQRFPSMPVLPRDKQKKALTPLCTALKSDLSHSFRPITVASRS